MESVSPIVELDKHLPHSLSPEIDKEAIRLELEAICSHRQFSLSRKSLEFLRYIVSETLEGRGDELKERTLGVRLYRRTLLYDTGSDSVVRVRASDLRKRLSCYYEEQSPASGWRIHLPLHSYVPLFLPELDNQEPLTLELPQEEAPVINRPLLSLRQLMQPTLVFLFLCAAIFRWEVFSSTPYQVFWTTLLRGHSGIVLILDTHSSNPRDINMDDVNLSEPLQETAIAFHVPIQIEGLSDVSPADTKTVLVHLTHNLPGTTQRAIDPNTAYIRVVPGNHPGLWIQSESSTGLQLAIHSISNADDFPFALEGALHRRENSLIRISQQSTGQLSAVLDNKP